MEVEQPITLPEQAGEDLIQIKKHFTINLLNSWLKEDEELFSDYDVCSMFGSLERFIFCLFNQRHDILGLVAIIYANSYVNASKKLFTRTQIAYILTIAAWTAAKFWEDDVIKISKVSELTDIPVEKLYNMQLKFLETIQWNLMIHPEDEFVKSIVKIWSKFFA